MSNDPSKPNRPLSEISHLFLSSIRDAAGNGQPRPQRTPPKANVSMDLTPEEYAQVYGVEAATDGTPAQHLEQDRIAPITAVIGAHLSGRQFDRVKEYARHLAGPRKRIGLIEADASAVTASGAPAQLCTFRPSRRQPSTTERPRPPTIRTHQRRGGSSFRIPRQRNASGA